MAQTKEGAIKAAAKKAGITPEEYMRLVSSGQKRCSICKQWKPIKKFNKDNSRSDGLGTKCHDCIHSQTPYASLKGRVSTFKGKTHSEESRHQMSESAKKRGSNRTGAKHSTETKKLISVKTRERTPRGEANPNYKHGKFQVATNDRLKAEYQDWRKAVFARDNYTCQKCGNNKGGNLRAHHIKPFADHPDLRFAINNGITLCHVCHELEHFKPDSIRNQRKLKRGERLWGNKKA
mgnify:CR=1 FL=1